MASSKISFVDAKAVTLDREGVPTRIRVFRPGSNLDVRGLDAVYSTSMAKSILKANNRTDGRIPFDVAHGMTAPNAPPASHEAVGWGTLRCDSTGVWLDDIEWSPSFRAKLIDRRFAFISPTFLVDQDELKRTKGKRARITDILTVSLTNVPATSDISPIVNDKGDLVRRSVLRVVHVEKPVKRLHTSMAKLSNALSDDLAKRGDEDKEEPKDDADEAPESDREPVVRDDEEGDEGEKDIDLEKIDLDTMDHAETKKLCMHLMDKLADMKREYEKRGEEEDEDEEGEKRSIVNTLHADRLINYADKKGLLALPLKKLVQQERALRRDPSASKLQAKSKDRTDPVKSRTGATNNVIAGAFNAAQRAERRGATDDEIAAFLAEKGTDPLTAVRLGLNEQVRGKQWGMTVPTKSQKKAH